MSLYQGTNRIAGNNTQTATPEDISDKSVSFNDSGDVSSYTSYDEIASELSDNNIISNLIASLKRGGNGYKIR